MSYTGAIPDTMTRPKDWLATAPCKDDADAMFPGSNRDDIDYAKSFCRRCPAVERCLQWALETGEEHGVWGGLSEAERRTLQRRALRPISIDDYTGTPKTRSSTGLTLQQVWDMHTQPEGKHLLWTGPKVINRPQPVGQVTANRLAFYLDRGHWAQGDVKRTCNMRGCVRPAHLNDRVERDEETELAVAV